MKFLLLVIGLLCSNVVQAGLIQLQPERSSYQLGEMIQLELKITDVTAPLGAFWTQIMYQTEGLKLQLWSFGQSLNVGSGSLQFAEHNNTAGFLTLDEYVFPGSDPLQLAELQQQSFVLARITFQAVKAGEFTLAFNKSWLGLESYAGQLLDSSAADLTLKITATPVPEPATALLLLMAIAFIKGRKCWQGRSGYSAA